MIIEAVSNFNEVIPVKLGYSQYIDPSECRDPLMREAINMHTTSKMVTSSPKWYIINSVETCNIMISLEWTIRVPWSVLVTQYWDSVENMIVICPSISSL